jgi:hypothetical protein
VDLDLEQQDLEGPFECASCAVLVGELTDGWRALRTGEPDDDGPPELEFLCPDCVED